MIGAGAQQHGAVLQEGERLHGAAVSLEDAHAGGGGHRPEPHLSGHAAGAEHGGGGRGETEAAHRSLVAAQRLREKHKIYRYVLVRLSGLS